MHIYLGIIYGLFIVCYETCWRLHGPQTQQYLHLGSALLKTIGCTCIPVDYDSAVEATAKKDKPSREIIQTETTVTPYKSVQVRTRHTKGKRSKCITLRNNKGPN